MMKKFKNENGVVIVEASIVFPIMFLVIFLLLYTGNLYYQRCKVDALATNAAITGAAYCADPTLSAVTGGEMPSSAASVDLKPYRYMFTGEMENIAAAVEKDLSSKVRGMGSGLFDNMSPKSSTVDVEYNNGFVYSTFSVDVQYKIQMPIRLLGQKEGYIVNLSSHTEVPVSDTPEFIRNVNMAEDYIQRAGIDKKIDEATKGIQEAFSKVREFLNGG